MHDCVKLPQSFLITSIYTCMKSPVLPTTVRTLVSAVDTLNTNVPASPIATLRVRVEQEVNESSHPSQQDQGGYPHDQEDVLLKREVKRTAILHSRTRVGTLTIRRTCCSNER